MDKIKDNSQGGWKTCFYVVLLIMIIGLLFGFIILAWDNEVRRAVKNRLVGLDAYYCGGFFRVNYHGQKFPRLPVALENNDTRDYSWLRQENFLFIGHRLGPYSITGPNTIRSFKKGLEMGFVFFEVDILLTSDGFLICYHEESKDELSYFTYNDYLSKMRNRKMEPFLFSDLVKVVSKFPQVKIILDVKNRFEEAYVLIRNTIGESSLGKCFIPQIYFFEQAEIIRGYNFFAGEIFTSYRSALPTQKIIELARHFNICAVTLTWERFWEIRNNIPMDISILIHPVNDLVQAFRIKQAGGRGIYTGNISKRIFSDFLELIDD